MLDSLNTKTIFIYNFGKQLFLTITLEFWFFIICSFTVVYLEVLDHIDCEVSQEKNDLHIRQTLW